jgi:hypothetical protein
VRVYRCFQHILCVVFSFCFLSSCVPCIASLSGLSIFDYPSVSSDVTKQGCTLHAAASDKAYQLLAHGRWFSSGTPASSTTKTGCHDIAAILLKVVLNNHGQATGKLYHLWLRVECTLFCNLQSRVRTHSVLVIGLYELYIATFQTLQSSLIFVDCFKHRFPTKWPGSTVYIQN